MIEYFESNICNSGSMCFVCKKAQKMLLDNEKNEKFQRIKELTVKRGTEKCLKLNNLRTSYTYNLLNNNILLEVPFSVVQFNF